LFTVLPEARSGNIFFLKRSSEWNSSDKLGYTKYIVQVRYILETFSISKIVSRPEPGSVKNCVEA
jgi:hypothetical protein